MLSIILHLALSLGGGVDAPATSCAQQFHQCVRSGQDRQVCKIQADICKLERRAARR